MTGSAATLDECPHATHCSAATGCHGGVCLASWALRVEERPGGWYALSWSGPRGPAHEAQPAGAPVLDRPPKWVIRRELDWVVFPRPG